MSNGWEDLINPDDYEAGDVINLADLDLPDDWFHSTATQQYEVLEDVNDAERKFMQWWRRFGDQSYKLEAKFNFLPDRKYEADFVFQAQKLIVEVDGMFGGGRSVGAHRTIQGKERDAERDINALAAGWATVRIPTTWLDDRNKMKWAVKQINTILRYR